MAIIVDLELKASHDLVDDGETQILIDGFISRPSLFESIAGRPVTMDVPMVNHVLNEYRIHRLAAIIPAHSHYDHAMDVGAIANRSSASILGSETTANIARGAGVPEDQIVIAEAGAPYTFGDFTVTLVPSRHAPIGLRGEVPLAGTVDEPLDLPAPITAWREGGSYSIVVSHPQGTTIVQASAGYRQGALDDLHTDVVMLGVGLLLTIGTGLFLVGILILLFGIQADISSKHRQLTQESLYRLKKIELEKILEGAESCP